MDKQKQEKKIIDPSKKDCTNCGTSGAKLTCGACKASHYCSKACQKQHWKNGHKGACMTPDKRRPQAPNDSSGAAAEETSKVDESSECPICLDFLSRGTLCTLPCQHDFHRECVEALRKYGVLQACPLCRAALPDGPEKLSDDAVRIYVTLKRKVNSGKASWLSLTAPQKKLMAEVVVMWTTSANQGHAQAQNNLGVMYNNGQGVIQDNKKAAKWFRKGADQGSAEAHFRMGVMYNNGLGVEKDTEKAVKWFQKAAEQGHVGAQRFLGENRANA